MAIWEIKQSNVWPVWSKFSLVGVILEQVSIFSYLGCEVRHENDKNIHQGLTDSKESEQWSIENWRTKWGCTEE